MAQWVLLVLFFDASGAPIAFEQSTFASQEACAAIAHYIRENVEVRYAGDFRDVLSTECRQM